MQMENYLPTQETIDSAFQINDRTELPTRDEFYTNYPFFKYWKTDARLEVDEGINLYIHIPYCIQICDYCFYMKELVRSSDQVNEYVDHLCREIALVSETFSLSKRKVNSIYIGGGTPSVLTESQFGRLLDSISKNHHVANPEFTFEAEPGTFNKTKLQWYKASGINRISMGVQSFDDNIIKLSSRKHTAAQAINSIAVVHEMSGFSTNIDLLSGLAGENSETWEKSLDIALAQPVDMITIYKMKAYANTNVFLKGVHKQEIELPDAEQEIQFMTMALDKLGQSAFKPWSTFAFARSGYKHMYAENTWRGQDLIAYGASSFGKIGRYNYQNVNNTSIYYDRIKSGQLPVFRRYELTAKDAMVKELLLCTRLASYDKQEFVIKFGFDYFKLIPDTMAQLISKGFIQNDPDRLIFTKHGTLFGDFVGKILASSLKEKLGADAIGFSY
jgi:oxygen-independent coproporphyrinogen III oxidase